VNTARLDPELPLDYLLDTREQRIDRVLSNSFGFGGTNCSLVFSRAN
jgi:3-oxoacyl-[acyl-carrier-protein] synthase-1